MPTAGETTPTLPGRTVVQKSLTVGGKTDELTETAIDLAPALKEGVGLAVVSVEREAPAPGKNEWQQPVLAWVQVTHIGLDAFVDSDQMLAWCTSLDDGAPLAGVDLKLAPKLAQATSGPDGLARLTLAHRRRGQPVGGSTWRRYGDPAAQHLLLVAIRGLATAAGACRRAVVRLR